MSVANEIGALTGARDLLVKEGWRKDNSDTDGHGPRCLIGALSLQNLEPLEYRSLCHMLQTVSGWHDHMHKWNDEPERTLSDVLGLIDACVESYGEEPCNDGTGA